ncbi:MAG: acyltransferase [Spirochaetaceae bacterium]|jgi:hypothetical protein|nr:acyltransferase [Spirochaetaceae bacterium]
MYKPYQLAITEAKADVTARKSAISKLALFCVWPLARLYCAQFIGAARVHLENAQYFCAEYNAALLKNKRMIIAFRHPYGNEPEIMMWYIIYKLKRTAKKYGIKFSRHPFVRTLYGYEILRWGGPLARWIMPRIGALPVYHAKIDMASMREIDKAIDEGPYPIALAPEGQVTYTTDEIIHIETGAMRFGLQAAKRLENKDIPVEIMPFSFRFHYGEGAWRKVFKMLRRVEILCGINNNSHAEARGRGGFYTRIECCREYILVQNEKRYGIDTGENDRPLSFNDRVDAVIDCALRRTEEILGQKAREGNLFDKMYYLRQLNWDNIFIPGMYSLKKLPQVERSLADLKAGEAWHASRHLEMVDFCQYFKGPLPTPETSLHDTIEYVQNLFDFANRTMGGQFNSRRTIMPSRVSFIPGKAIPVNEHLAAYKQNKKETTEQLTEQLREQFLETAAEAAKNDRR